MTDTLAPAPQTVPAETLRETLHGDVLVEGDEGYDAARAVWNAMIDRRPALIARCRGTADVADAVRFAEDHGLGVSVRGGGHNVAGHAVADGALMIDLSAMRGVRVDPDRRVAMVEGGATWSDVDRETQAFGLATPGGLISDTGVGGLTLSGGIGWLRARHGLVIDNLVGAEVVTAGGRVVRTSAGENPDLLWALRGGGGNFGVVTLFELALHEVGPEVWFSAPIYPVEAGTAPIRAWRDAMVAHARRAGAILEYATVADGDPEFPEEAWGRPVYTMATVWNGDADEGEEALAPLTRLAEPVTDFSGRMAYRDVQKLFDTLIPAGECRSYWKSHFLGELTDEAIETLHPMLADRPTARTLCSVWPMGGAVADPEPGDTAFGERSMRWMVSLDGIWEDPADDRRCIGWVRDAWERLAPHALPGRLYLNFAGHDEEGAALNQRAFGDNWQRLVRLKTKYDPANLFRHNQNIPPSA